VLGAVVLFGMLLRPAGLVAALLALIGVSAYASHEFRLREIVRWRCSSSRSCWRCSSGGSALVIPLWPAFMLR